MSDIEQNLINNQGSLFNRREFLGLTAVSTALAGLAEVSFMSEASAATKPISSTPVTATLPELPYANTALTPTITANTISFHYGKHHAGYLTNLNALLASTSTDKAVIKVIAKLKNKTLEEIISATYGKKDTTSISAYRNAAQVYNHNFYWKSLSPTGGGVPVGKILTLINAGFTDFATFKTKLIDTAVAQFGTGWAWVILDKKGKLQIISTNDADNPLIMPGVKPVLTIDVWEHAYYLDYQNLRKTHVTAVIDKLLNWEFANQNVA